MKNKYIHWILAILIGVFALVSVCANFVLIFASRFAFSDIDYSEAERQTAEIKSFILSVFFFISFCISVLILFLCGKISEFILKIFGFKIDE